VTAMVHKINDRETVIYRGGHHVVVCNGDQHFQVLEDGRRIPNGTCVEWHGGCPNRPEATAAGVLPNYLTMNVADILDGKLANDGLE